MTKIDHCLLCGGHEDVWVADLIGKDGFNCPNCGRYYINFGAKHFLFDCNMLNEEHKRTLINYVQQHQPKDPTNEDEVPILDLGLIKKLTGVESRGEHVS